MALLVLLLFIECPVGSYGNNCRENCSVNCRIPKTCSRETGRCTNGCQSGWNGITCKTSRCLKSVSTYIVISVDFLTFLKILNLSHSYVVLFCHSIYWYYLGACWGNILKTSYCTYQNLKKIVCDHRDQRYVNSKKQLFLSYTN